LTAALRREAAASGNPARRRSQGAAVMSDLTRESVETFPTPNTRRGRTRRAAPVETGTDLLNVSSRLTSEEARVLAEARAILLRLSTSPAPRALTAPANVREYLTMLLSGQEREYFVAIALDNRHRLLASEILFAGTIDSAGVHPREVVKFALRHNAAALVVAHGHPSSVLEPSQADELITRRLVSALQLIDVRVLDHVVVGSGLCYSFAEAGRL
jgi:DNA repair protein RadC